MARTGVGIAAGSRYPSVTVIPYADIFVDANVRDIRKILENNGLVVYPTDTLYGLGGNFMSQIVQDKIDRLKNRSDMPYSAAVSGLAMLESLVEPFSGEIADLLARLLPGKFTFLMTPSRLLEPVLIKNSNKIGVRIPASPPLLRLIELLDMPLVTTSVNRSGQSPFNDPEEILKQFGTGETPLIDLVIDAGGLPVSTGSTIVDITVAPYRVIRRGDEYWRWESLGIPFIS